MSPPNMMIFYEALEKCSIGIIILDKNLHVTFFNKWMEKHAFVNSETITGKHFGKYFPDLPGSHIENSINNALNIDTPSSLSHMLNNKILPLYHPYDINKESRIAQAISITPLTILSGTEKFCMIQVTDVTYSTKREKKLIASAEKEKSLSQLKSEFISTVSHELRTPLTSIRAALSLVGSGVITEVSAEVKRLIDIAFNNTERLLFLINDILDIEKIEAGKMDFSMGPVALQPILARSTIANQPYAEQYKAVIKIECDTDYTVYADTDRLLQVMNNLLSNAAKFSPTGGIIKISADNSGSNDNIRVSVSDQGSGIPGEFRDKIFEKFSQADSSTTRQVGGTGLGLSICKSIMENMGGNIDFVSSPENGTIFFIDLPVWDDSPRRNRQTGRKRHSA